MTISAELAARIIAGTYRGSLLLTVDEVREMIEHVDGSAVVIVESRAVRVCDVPVFIIDNIDPFPTIDRTEWNRQLLASMADGLLDHHDLDRLWRRP